MKTLLSRALCALALALLPAPGQAQTKHYVGGDISLLPEYEKAGAKYKTHDGQTVADLLPWCREQGMNAMRVRLFVNPDKYFEQKPSADRNACQDLDYILPLCKRIVDDGFDLMLDYHYSDTWADPVKQFTPIDWQGLTDEELYQKIYDYTFETLTTLKENGIVPAFIQPGNEISYGMLWGPEGGSYQKCYSGSDENWDRFGTLLKQAIKACHEVCPDAKIILHNERVAKPAMMRNFYDQMARMEVPYDIIGLSYYPYFHGDLSVLDSLLGMLEKTYKDKNIMIVETGYALKWEVPGTTIDNTDKWPYTDAGQAQFARDLIACLDNHPVVDGLFWWWMEYNPYNTSLSGWYNASLFDPTTGRATTALSVLCSFANDSALEPVVSGGEGEHALRWFDSLGRPVSEPSAPGLYLRSDGRKAIF